MSSTTEVQPYGSIQLIAPDLYCLDGEWNQTLFKRRMTIIRLQSGGLVIHNAIRLQEKDYAKLEDLGPISVIVVPNHFHSSEAHFYKQRYPRARLLVAKSIAPQISEKCPVDGLLPDAWDESLRREIDCMEFTGTRIVNESVFLHRSSKTLILTDLAFNMQCEVYGGARAFFKLNLIYKRFGPSRIFRYVFVNNRQKAKEAFRKIQGWDFERVIVNHGDIISADGKRLLRDGFEQIGLA